MHTIQQVAPGVGGFRKGELNECVTASGPKAGGRGFTDLFNSCRIHHEPRKDKTGRLPSGSDPALAGLVLVPSGGHVSALDTGCTPCCVDSAPSWKNGWRTLGPSSPIREGTATA